MLGIDLATWAVIKEGSAAVAPFAFLIFFSKAYLKSVSRIADEVTASTAQHILALTQVKDALVALTIQVTRNTDVIVKCKGPEG